MTSTPTTSTRSFPETSHKNSQVKGLPPCIRRSEDILILGDGELGAEKSVQTNLVKLTLVFLIISSPLTTPNLTLSYQFFTHLLFLCLKGIKASTLRGLHSLVKAPRYVQKFNKIGMLFLLLSCFCQFNFQTQPRTLEGSRETFSSPTLTYVF